MSSRGEGADASFEDGGSAAASPLVGMERLDVDLDDGQRSLPLEMHRISPLPMSEGGGLDGDGASESKDAIGAASESPDGHRHSNGDEPAVSVVAQEDGAEQETDQIGEHPAEQGPENDGAGTDAGQYSEILRPGGVPADGPGLDQGQTIGAASAASDGNASIERYLDVILAEQGATVRVLVVDENRGKAFFGGFRNKATNVEYHHAAAQCAPPKLDVEGQLSKERFHRECQTKFVVARSVQGQREQCAQTGEKFNDPAYEKVLYSKPYFDSMQWDALRLEKVIILQSHVRAWFARRHTHSLRSDLVEKSLDRVQQEEGRQKQAETDKRLEIERRMHPKTAADFRTLYEELEAWRLSETAKIKQAQDLDHRSKKEHLRELFHRETALLQTIHRLKLAAGKENKHAHTMKQLEDMAAEKTFKSTTGDTVNIETPYTVRARELADLFSGLKLRQISVDERLDILLHVKWTVKEFDCQLTRHIVELIDREADLLNRGRSEKSVESLRLRIQNLFLQFIETPEFNPEASRFARVPLDYLKRPQVAPTSLKKKPSSLQPAGPA